MSAPDVAPVDVVLAEYKALKDEQARRVAFRDGLPYVALAAAVAAAGVAVRFSPAVLLALPVACVVLGWTFLANDHKVSELGCYIRTVLTPYLQEQVPAGTPVFGWESFHRVVARRRTRKAWQLLTDLTAFCATSVAALVAYWAHGDLRPAVVAVSAGELAMTLGLAYQIARHAELSSKRRER